MRKILTRYASIFMALAMILLAVPTVEANADEVVIRVHFKNTEYWSNVYVYSWDKGGSPILGGWPGTDITATKDGDYYTAEIKDVVDSSLNIIFGDGGSVQTVDILCDLTKGTEWWVVPKETDNDGKWVCGAGITKEAAESGTVEKFEPQAPANPTIKKSPVIDGNKVTFYYECTNADKVQIAGSMTDWGMKDMQKDGNVYSYTCEASVGDHQYKFIVNGNIWITDPMNETTVDDGAGNTNSGFTVTATGGTTTPDPNPGTTVTSPVVEGGKVTFKYESSTATKVEVFGSMNDWASGFEMTKNGDVFTYTMELPNDEYEYKFVIDGTAWENDPANPNKAGNGNNVFTITGGADAPQTPDEPAYTPTIKESLVIDGNKVTFYYESPTASNVEVFGSMNAWAAGYQMTKEGNVFSFTMELEKGDYQYKFVVDGEWINDPLNDNKADGNNVLSIISDAPVTDDTQTPDAEQTPSGDALATGAPMSDGVIILISAIVTIVAVLGGFAVYLFIKKKRA